MTCPRIPLASQPHSDNVSGSRITTAATTARRDHRAGMVYFLQASKYLARFCEGDRRMIQTQQLTNRQKVHGTIRAKDRARARYEETAGFLDRHPEYTHRLGALIGTVTSCPASGFHLPGGPLEAAHIHVFGGEGHPPCQWCKRNFKIVTEDDERYYNRIPPER